MIAARRERNAALLLIAFGALWAVRCIVAEGPASLHQDMLEAYVWGQEFQLGYNQHPPFWAWMCGLWFAVFPRVDASFAVFSARFDAAAAGGLEARRALRPRRRTDRRDRAARADAVLYVPGLQI